MTTDDMDTGGTGTGGTGTGGKGAGGKGAGGIDPDGLYTDTSPASQPRWYAQDERPRWYAGAIVGTATVLVALVLAAIFADDPPHTLLGFFTGLLGALLLMVVSWTEFGVRDAARRRDAAALDDLEPLRSAAAADRADER